MKLNVTASKIIELRKPILKYCTCFMSS